VAVSSWCQKFIVATLVKPIALIAISIFFPQKNAKLVANSKGSSGMNPAKSVSNVCSRKCLVIAAVNWIIR
jgi:hypothetical protein